MSEVRPSLVDRWHELARGAMEPNPFFEPEFVLPAVAHLAHEGVRLLTVSEGSALRVCLPVEVVRLRGQHGPSILRSWIHKYCFLGTPLIDQTTGPEATKALSRLLLWYRPLLVLGAVATDGRVLEALDRHLARRGRRLYRYDESQRALLTDRPSLQGGAPALAKVERRRRAAERELGPLRFVDRTTPDGVEQFLAIEASGWKGREGTALLSRPGDATFFRQMCAGFAESNRLEVRALVTPDGAVMAMSVRIRAGEGLFSFKVGYDEAFRRHGPGRLLAVDAVEQFAAQSAATWVDSCTDPGNTFLETLYPGRRHLASIIVGSEGVVAGAIGRVAVGTHRRRRAGSRTLVGD